MYVLHQTQPVTRIGTEISRKNSGSCGRVGGCAPFSIATAPFEHGLADFFEEL